MLWLRGLLFTLLEPCVVGVVIPLLILEDGGRLAGGWWHTGWLLVAAGGAFYLTSLIGFLSAGGTPSIYFTRDLKAIFGEEPARVVTGGFYRLSRNPMYLGVVLVVSGMAIVHASRAIAVYGAVLAIFFHAVVVFLEEPHLRRERGTAYDEYCRRVPRWLGRRAP